MKTQLMILGLILSIALIAGCTIRTIVGNDRDEHGCIGSAGYSWCEAKQKCLRTWEENCTDNKKYMTLNELNDFCGVPGECNKKMDCEGKEVRVKAHLTDYVNVFDKKNYPQLPYEKFDISDVTRQIRIDVNTVSDNNTPIFDKIEESKENPVQMIFITATVEGFDMPIMGPCTRGIYLKVNDANNVDFRCGACPQLSSPGPNFCPDGTIVAGEKNECDCQGPPKCLRACTEEAKICPDGTAVGRNSENNCEFDPCPGETGGAGIANPASVFCEEQGGESKIITAQDGSQSGVCVLKDGTECDEWAYLRGECPE
jgi:putative hemolysin